MKIAIVSDDSQTVSQHFGRATRYVVLTIDDGRVTAREVREKLGHTAAHSEHAEHSTEEADHRHQDMISVVGDCTILVAGRMGPGAYEAIRARGVRPILTEFRTVDEVADAFARGSLVDRPERLHM